MLVGEGAVHQPLEGLGGILQAERHVEVLEKGVMTAVLGTSVAATGTWW